jgi:alpha-N-arabinofuranosidase
MYIPFQDATYLPVSYDAEPAYRYGDVSVPAVSATAARGADGKLYASVANLDPHEAAGITLEIDGGRVRNPSARILTADAMDSHNTFEAPHTVAPRRFDELDVAGGALRFELPPMSIVMIELD